MSKLDINKLKNKIITLIIEAQRSSDAGKNINDIQYLSGIPDKYKYDAKDKYIFGAIELMKKVNPKSLGIYYFIKGAVDKYNKPCAIIYFKIKDFDKNKTYQISFHNFKMSQRIGEGTPMHWEQKYHSKDNALNLMYSLLCDKGLAKA